MASIALVLASGCGGGIQIVDVEIPRPVPESSCLVIGFLGGRDAWDDSSKGVRRLAVKLRSEDLLAETFENRRRSVALEVVRDALDRNGDGAIDAQEAGGTVQNGQNGQNGQNVRLVVYGQSFGGAAVVKFAHELNELGVPIELTVQIDSVGRDDALIPPNVRSAANLYQTDGWFLDGEHPIRAEDPEATRILGNWRFDYSEPPGRTVTRRSGRGSRSSS